MKPKVKANVPRRRRGGAGVEEKPLLLAGLPEPTKQFTASSRVSRLKDLVD